MQLLEKHMQNLHPALISTSFAIPKSNYSLAHLEINCSCTTQAKNTILQNTLSAQLYNNNQCWKSLKPGEDLTI